MSNGPWLRPDLLVVVLPQAPDEAQAQGKRSEYSRHQEPRDPQGLSSYQQGQGRATGKRYELTERMVGQAHVEGRLGRLASKVRREMDGWMDGWIGNRRRKEKY